MTKERLKTIKGFTVWGGILIALVGVLLNIAKGGWQGNILSIVGLIITFVGHCIASALAKHQAAESVADKMRVTDLESRLDAIDAEKQRNQEIIERIVSKPGIVQIEFDDEPK